MSARQPPGDNDAIELDDPRAIEPQRIAASPHGMIATQHYLATEAGIKCVYISNGNATPEVLEYLRPYLTGYKIDLKTMQDRQYRKLGGVLENVLDGIRLAHELGLWVEVVTLVVPGFNDSTEELMEAARYITSVSPNIPWHVSAFHPDYKMMEPPRTSVKTLRRRNVTWGRLRQPLR